MATGKPKTSFKKENVKLLVEIYLLLMLVLINFGLKDLSLHDRPILFISFLLILGNSLIFLAKFKIVTREYVREIVNSLFLICLVIFLLLLLASEFRSEIKDYINLNYFLIIVIILGIYVFLRPRKEEKKVAIKKSDYYFIFLCGIVGCVVVWYKIKNLGTLSYVISFLSGILIITLSFLLLKEEKIPKMEISPEKPKPVMLPEEKRVELIDTKEKELKKIEIEKFKIINRLWDNFVMRVTSFVYELENSRPDDYFELYKRHKELLDSYRNFTLKFGEHVLPEEKLKILKKFHYCSSILADLLKKL